MDRWSLLGAVLFGGIFATFAIAGYPVPSSKTIRFAAIAFLFGTYCAIVAFGTSGKRRTFSLLVQTVLGMALALAIAALLSAGPEGYVLAVVLGAILGYTADWWVGHVQLP